MTEILKARSAELETRLVDDQLILLDLRTEHYLKLNRAGAELWPLLVEGVERATLVRALQDRHHLDEAVAQRDVTALVQQLETANLLEPPSDAPPDA